MTSNKPRKEDHTVSSEHLSAIDLLGTRLEGTFTAEQAMEQGLLGNWNVRKSPLQTVVDGKTIPIPGMSAVIRDNPAHKGRIDVLSRYGVSDSYSIVQNEDHAAFLNALVEESGSNFELAGSVDGGRKVFISMKMPGHIRIGGVDQIDMSLLAMNSHDGSMSFTLAVMPVRYACSNVLNSIHRGNSGLIRIRHTSGAKKNMVAQAREALDLSFKYLDTFQEEAERLINTTMTQLKFEEIVQKEFGADEDASPSVQSRASRKVDEMVSLFSEALTQEGVRDTAWAGYNALTEWADHFSPTRSKDDDAARAQRAILDPTFKSRALRLMLANI
jgi:phage/plasmid-like protein (TIGR03299 family)